MAKYNSRYEYVRENMTDWLKDFADKEGEKLATKHNITPEEVKNANYADTILDIVNRKKKMSVEEKVAKYREAVGLDIVNDDVLSKEGNKEVVASRVVLSMRDKTAQNDKAAMENIKQYVDEVMKNRNGVIATPALFEQFENYMRLDKEWLRANYDAINEMIKGAREEFRPQTYNEIEVNDLARTDDPSKGENTDPTPFLPPSQAPGA